MDLPTIEEAQAFLAVVNRGRVAFGLEPVKYLEFDTAKPMHPLRCLSATNLFVPVGCTYVAEVGAEVPPALRERLASVLGTRVIPCGIEIPSVIRNVTDPFDSQVAGLRERLVEAGVVEDR